MTGVRGANAPSHLSAYLAEMERLRGIGISDPQFRATFERASELYQRLTPEEHRELRRHGAAQVRAHARGLVDAPDRATRDQARRTLELLDRGVLPGFGSLVRIEDGARLDPSTLEPIERPADRVNVP